MPPKVAHVEIHDKMIFYHPNGHPHDTLRDLGYSGVIDGQIVWCFGDTLMGTEKQNMICATDSTAIGKMEEPMGAIDTSLWPNSNNVKEWIPCNDQEAADGGLSVYAFGGTNIVEYAPNQGLVYYLKIRRPGGKPTIHGAGVATVRMEHGEHGPYPVATRHSDHMWTNHAPNWGDVGIAYNAQDGHVYVYGHGANDPELSVRTFLCRAPANQATDINSYEYWLNDVRQWTKQRLSDGNIKHENKHAVFQWMVMNQSAPFWSNYFNKWMLLYGACWGTSDVLCMTADQLEGPWAEHDVVASTKPPEGMEGLRYCHTGHPEFDPTGKTVLATWTLNNKIYGATIEWQ